MGPRVFITVPVWRATSCCRLEQRSSPSRTSQPLLLHMLYVSSAFCYLDGTSSCLVKDHTDTLVLWLLEVNLDERYIENLVSLSSSPDIVDIPATDRKILTLNTMKFKKEIDNEKGVLRGGCHGA